MTVLVIGGTRGVGRLAALELDRAGRPVRVLARDPEAARQALPEGIEIVPGDLTRPETLGDAVAGAAHVLFTAGVRSARPASEALVRATDYEGVLHTLQAAHRAGMAGRFVYLNSLGVRTASLSAALINLMKRNALRWRAKSEDAIRASGLDYAIGRVGFLTDAPAGRRRVAVSQGALPLSPWRTIARADAAQGFVAALDHPRASRASFEMVQGSEAGPTDWTAALAALQPDLTPPPPRP